MIAAGTYFSAPHFFPDDWLTSQKNSAFTFCVYLMCFLRSLWIFSRSHQFLVFIFIYFSVAERRSANNYFEDFYHEIDGLINETIGLIAALPQSSVVNWMETDRNMNVGEEERVQNSCAQLMTARCGGRHKSAKVFAVFSLWRFRKIFLKSN